MLPLCLLKRFKKWDVQTLRMFGDNLVFINSRPQKSAQTTDMFFARSCFSMMLRDRLEHFFKV